MIADPRADALMTAFTGQWLQLRNLDKVTPDVLLFPDFDDNVRQALRRETELLLREHRAREPLARSICSTPTTRSSTSGWRATTASAASTARASAACR